MIPTRLLRSLSLLMLACVLCLPGAAQRHGRHARRAGAKHKVISAAEARAARVRKAQLGKNLHRLKGNIHEVRAKIRRVKVRESHLNENIQTVQRRLQTARARLQAVNDRLRSLERRHDVVVARMEQTRQRLLKRRRLLGVRVRESYLRGQLSYAQVLLEAGSLQELMSRGVYVRQIVHSDAELIRGVQRDLRQIQTDKLELEAQAREQQALAAEYESRKTEYAADLARERELLRAAQAVRAEAQDELDEMESEAEEMTGRIQALSAMLERRREAERLAQAERMRSRERSGGSQQEPEVAPIWHGDFIRPCAGPITSGFGYRYHPILHQRRLHTGVDIGAPYGASIHAAGGGTVILASYVRGYGNCVIIDHGNGLTTLYGHCSELLVSEGQSVGQDQTIARVGATGLATGPHLHFEVRRNGVPVPPF